MKIEITLPDEIGVARSDGRCVVKPINLSPEIIARLVEHGIVQKVGDAAAGAANKAEKDETPVDAAHRLMNAARDRLYEGVWTAHGGGSSVDPVERFIHQIMRKNLSKDEKTAYKDADAAGRAAMLSAKFDALPEAQAEAVRKTATALYEMDRKLKADADALIGKIDIPVEA